MLVSPKFRFLPPFLIPIHFSLSVSEKVLRTRGNLAFSVRHHGSQQGATTIAYSYTLRRNEEAVDREDHRECQGTPGSRHNTSRAIRGVRKTELQCW